MERVLLQSVDAGATRIVHNRATVDTFATETCSVAVKGSATAKLFHNLCPSPTQHLLILIRPLIVVAGAIMNVVRIINVETPVSTITTATSMGSVNNMHRNPFQCLTQHLIPPSPLTAAAGAIMIVSITITVVINASEIPTATRKGSVASLCRNPFQYLTQHLIPPSPMTAVAGATMIVSITTTTVVISVSETPTATKKGSVVVPHRLRLLSRIVSAAPAKIADAVPLVRIPASFLQGPSLGHVKRAVHVNAAQAPIVLIARPVPTLVYFRTQAMLREPVVSRLQHRLLFQPVVPANAAPSQPSAR